MGTREAGFTSCLPGYRKFESADDRAELAALWNVPVERIPTARGLAYPDIIEAALDRADPRALDHRHQSRSCRFPNLGVLKQALEALEFLVVQDGFHPTPTSELADLVLPAAIWGEKEGTYTNSERRVSKVNAAVEPPGEARSDFDIFLDSPRRSACRDELFPGWTKPRGRVRGVEARVGRPAVRLLRHDLRARSKQHGGIQWPYPRRRRAMRRRRRRLYTDGQFQTEDGKARLIPTDWEPFPEQPNAEFPLVLNTGRTVEHWHTRTKTGNVPILERLSPHAWVEMNPRDAPRAAA